MVYLETRAAGRDNNLNLIRMLAATAVLVSHAWPISQGVGTIEPLKALTGYTLGTLSVMVFFVISGFLITASFQRTSSYTSFLLARGLRLLPGLLVNLIFVALILAPIMTTLSIAAYFGGAEPYAFILRNMALFPLVYELPGVLEEQPYPSIVGSIWTLRHEVMCYAGVFIAGVLGLWRTRSRAGLTLGIYGLVWAGIALTTPDLTGIVSGFVGLSLPFAIGIAFYVWRDRLPLSIIGVIATAGLAWALAGSWAYPAALSLSVGYGTFWLSIYPVVRSAPITGWAIIPMASMSTPSPCRAGRPGLLGRKARLKISSIPCPRQCCCRCCPGTVSYTHLTLPTKA